MKKEVFRLLDERVMKFVKTKETDLNALKKDLYFILDEAFKNGGIPYRMVADVNIEGEKLKVEIGTAHKMGWELDLNGDYEVNNRPDQEEWPESVATYPPVPLEKIREIENTALEHFRAKLEPGMLLIQREGESLEDARKRRDEEVDKYLEEFDKEVSAQLHFEMKQGFPKNPWKEIDGCIVVRK